MAVRVNQLNVRVSVLTTAGDIACAGSGIRCVWRSPHFVYPGVKCHRYYDATACNDNIVDGNWYGNFNVLLKPPGASRTGRRIRSNRSLVRSKPDTRLRWSRWGLRKIYFPESADSTEEFDAIKISLTNRSRRAAPETINTVSRSPRRFGPVTGCAAASTVASAEQTVSRREATMS